MKMVPAVIDDLRCEYLTNPTVVDAPRPRFSWKMRCPRKGAAQSAYRILVATSRDALREKDADCWDSGVVASSQSQQIHYAGPELSSSQQVFWKVKIWDENGTASRWSKPAHFTAGLLEREAWQGVYIGNYLSSCQASPLLRKSFTVKAQPKRVLLYATAQGLFYMTLNGRGVSDEAFAPGWTDYRKRRHYRCYDVTSRVRKAGSYCLGAELAEGWFKGRIGWQHGDTYGNRLMLLAQLRIEYADGTVETVATDSSWKSVFGPTRRAGFYDGESYDAQLEPRGWNRPGFDDSGWSDAVEKAIPENMILQAYPAEPVRATEALKPVKHWNVAPGKVIYDFGQNFAGRVRLHVPGKAGCVVQMRFGEMVNHDNTLYIDNMRSALCTDTYVMKGAKLETWEPRFTFHGFRYVEVSGCPVPPSVKNVTGVVLGSDTRRVGHFECSSTLINQIYSNAVWTQRSNFLEVPTDCPQRDERLGWTGDAQVFIRTAICNMDVAAFFTKWMDDLIDSQNEAGAFPNVAPDVLNSPGGAAWGDAGVVCPWTLYSCYEDETLLRKMYPAMKRWIAYLKKTSNGLLCERTQCFGDWLAVGADTPKAVVRTAHFAHATDLTRKAAEALGERRDAKRYAVLFKEIRRVFQKHFVKQNGKIEGDTQTAYLMALKFGLLGPKGREKAVKHLLADICAKDNHISTGFVGTAMVMSVLRDTGNLDVAYTLLENTTFPSWGYSVENGATTIWERWNGWTKEGGPGNVNMNSYSHYAYGAVVEWMFDTIAGIDHGECGFKHFVLKPRPGGSLKHAAASYESPYGLIESKWDLRGNKMTYEITIPPNTSATVDLPTDDPSGVKLDGMLLTDQLDVSKEGCRFTLPAGQYRLSVQT